MAANTPLELRALRHQEQDMRCWREAAEKYNSLLARGAKSKKFIVLDPQQPLSTETLEAVAADIHKLCNDRKLLRGRATRVFLQLLNVTNHVLLHPDDSLVLPLDLVTRPLRKLSASLQDNEMAAETVGDGIITITERLPQWKLDSEDWTGCDQVNRSRVFLYVAVLAFVKASERQFSRREKLGSFFDPKGRPTPLEKVRVKLKSLKKAAGALEQKLGLAKQKAMCDGIMKACKTLQAQTRDVGFEWWYESNPGTAGIAAADIMEQSLGTERAYRSPGPDQLADLSSSLDPCPIVVGDGDHAPSPGTGELIVRHQLFASWRQNDSSHSLWVCGAPGTGKSVLAQGVLAELKPGNDIVLSFRFGASWGPASNTTNRMVASILGELLLILSRRPSLSQDCKPGLRRALSLGRQNLDGRGPKFQLREVLAAFEELVRAQTVRTILVIDGLDECGSSVQGVSTQAPARLVEELLALSERSSLKLILFSRPEPSFRHLICASPSITLDKNLVHNDVMAVSDTLYDTLELPLRLKSEAMAHIKEAAEGSFLWATVFLKNAARHGISIPEIQRSLNQFPTDLGEAYKASLENQAKARGFDEKKLKFRRMIFMILLAAQSPVTVEMLAAAMELDEKHAAKKIHALCRPLVDITEKDQTVAFIHHSAREFIQRQEGSSFSRGEPDALLAAKCLDTLLAPTYASLTRIAAMLRQKNAIAELEESPTPSGEQDDFYDYAAQFWSVHLANVTEPQQQLVQSAADFLHKRQFAYWGEYVTGRQNNEFGGIGVARDHLGKFEACLTEPQRQTLGLRDFFVVPYRELTEAYRENEEADKVLPWLALRQLGCWYFFASVTDKMVRVREEVVAGLTRILGAENPLTLRARSEVAFAYISEGDMRKANVAYSEIAQLQRKAVSVDERRDLYLTLMRKGQTEYFLTGFDLASQTEQESLLGFLDIDGPTSYGYLAARLWQACALLECGPSEDVVDILLAIHKARRSQYGDSDGFAVYVEMVLGNVYRQQGAREQSLAGIGHALEARKRSYKPDTYAVLDAQLALAVARRDFGDLAEASAILSEVKKHVGRHDESGPLFPRYCQAVHVDALVRFEQGEREVAEQALQSLLIDTDRGNENRALMWARLDLADMIRARGEDNEALALFDGLVKPVRSFTEGTDTENDDDDDPDPPARLAIAEEALRLARAGKQDKARQLLGRNGLEWVRPRDLWLWVGGPAADTASIRRLSLPPKEEQQVEEERRPSLAAPPPAKPSILASVMSQAWAWKASVERSYHGQAASKVG